MNDYDELGQFFEEGLQKDQTEMMNRVDKLTQKADARSWALEQLTHMNGKKLALFNMSWAQVIETALRFRKDLEEIDLEYAAITGHSIKVDNPWLKF